MQHYQTYFHRGKWGPGGRRVSKAPLSSFTSKASRNILVEKKDHIKYAGTFLVTSYFIEFNDVDIDNLAGYEERTRVLYMIRSPFS